MASTSGFQTSFLVLEVDPFERGKVVGAFCQRGDAELDAIRRNQLQSPDFFATTFNYAVSKILPDPGDAFDAHRGAAQVLGGAFAQLQLDTQNILDPAFQHALGTGAVTILRPGRYQVSANVSTEKTVGNQRADSDARLTLNGVEIAGTRRLMYNRNLSQSGSSCSIDRVFDLAVGDVLTFEARHRSGAGTVSTLVDGVSLQILKIS